MPEIAARAHLTALDAMVRDALREAGVEIVAPETLPMREQIALFAERPAVLGTIGAGLHTSVFVPSAARILALSTIRFAISAGQRALNSCQKRSSGQSSSLVSSSHWR